MGHSVRKKTLTLFKLFLLLRSDSACIISYSGWAAQPIKTTLSILAENITIQVYSMLVFGFFSFSASTCPPHCILFSVHRRLGKRFLFPFGNMCDHDACI